MNLKKLTVFSALFVAVILILGTTAVYAGGHGMVNRGIFDRYRVNAWWSPQVMDANTDAFVFHGIGFAMDNVKEMVDWLPVDVDFFINGEEVKMKRYNEAWPNQYHWTSPGPDIWWLGEHKGKLIELWFMFYQTFDAGYFAPGDYALHIDYYIQNGNLVLQIDGTLKVV